MNDFIGLILAAGEGRRMKSNLPKVLHSICGRPMIDYVIDSLQKARVKKLSIVINKRQQALLDYLRQRKGVKFVFQKKPLGTANAIKSARTVLAKAKGNVLVICADAPLVRKETLAALMDKHKESRSACTILTSYTEDSFGFGRIVRDEFSKVLRIIEENDASISQKQISEVNSGMYCFKTQDLLQALNQVEINKKKKEFYLTDIIQILYEKNKRIETCDCADSNEIFGINSRLDLSKANDIMRMRIIEDFMEEGVAILSPKTTFINFGSSIGQDTTIFPFTFIESGVKIGENCSVGPFCHLREGSVIKDKNIVGNFTEINRTSIGKGTILKHFCYLGDATIGENVNIGAGTVIANFDGESKKHTVIKDDAMIGCDTVIVAPAKIGKAVVTGAGSVITKFSDIKDKSVIVGVPAKLLPKSSKVVAKKVKRRSKKKKYGRKKRKKR